jgi:hypothetical protein
MDEIAALLDAHVPALARALQADPGRDQPLRWFDGFWDFVVRARAALERAAAWHLTGATTGLPWFFLCVRLSGDAPAPWQVHVFVELRSPPGSVAPWPVSSITLHDGQPVAPGPAERQRPLPAGTHAALRALGLDVMLGDWGVHLAATGAGARAFLAQGPAAWQRAIELALRAGTELAAAEAGHAPD